MFPRTGLSIARIIAVCTAALLLRTAPAAQPPPPPRFDTELNQPPPAPPPAVRAADGSPYVVASVRAPSNGAPGFAPQMPGPAYGGPPQGMFGPPPAHAAGPVDWNGGQESAGRFPAASMTPGYGGPPTGGAPSAAPPYGAVPYDAVPYGAPQRDGGVWAQTPSQLGTTVSPSTSPSSPFGAPTLGPAATGPLEGEPSSPSVPEAEQAPLTIFKPSQIIAWVGDQPIQVGDVMPLVEQIIAPHLAEMEPQVVEQQKAAIEQQKDKLMKQALDSVIQTKLLYLDFLRTIPADKKKEVLPKIMSRAEEQFVEKQLPEAMQKAKVETRAELEAKLREFGSSIQRQKQAFVERAFGQSVLSQKVNYEPEITHQAMLDYYYAHLAEYEISARARWEKLSVRFDRFANKQQAWAALGEMGNEVLRGAALGAVAQRRSQTIDAPEGGYHDWTSQGSLASDVLDQAIFSLPLGRLSERIEDAEGFHIVRVIERTEPTRTPFEQAQVDIKEILRKEHVKEQVNAYVAKLKQEIPVWNSFDDPPPQTAAAASAERRM